MAKKKKVVGDEMAVLASEPLKVEDVVAVNKAAADDESARMMAERVDELLRENKQLRNQIAGLRGTVTRQSSAEKRLKGIVRDLSDECGSLRAELQKANAALRAEREKPWYKRILRN